MIKNNNSIILGYSYQMPRVGTVPSVISGLQDVFTNVKYATFPYTQDKVKNTYVQVYGFYEPKTEHFFEEYTIVDSVGDKIQYKTIYKAIGQCTNTDATKTIVDGVINFGVTSASGKYMGSKIVTMEFLNDSIGSRIITIYK